MLIARKKQYMVKESIEVQFFLFLKVRDIKVGYRYTLKAPPNRIPVRYRILFEGSLIPAQRVVRSINIGMNRDVLISNNGRGGRQLLFLLVRNIQNNPILKPVYMPLQRASQSRDCPPI